MGSFSPWSLDLLRSIRQRELNFEGIGTDDISKNLRVGPMGERWQYEEEHDDHGRNTDWAGDSSHQFSLGVASLTDTRAAVMERISLDSGNLAHDIDVELTRAPPTSQSRCTFYRSTRFVVPLKLGSPCRASL
jgi:hypothetical protein